MLHFFLFIPKLVTLDNQIGDSGLSLAEEQQFYSKIFWSELVSKGTSYLYT